MKKITLIISMILCSTAVFSQEDSSNFDGIRKNAISFNFLGTTPIIGITYERILFKHLSLEVGVGIPSVGAGIKVFFKEIEEQKMMFNTGLTVFYVDFGDDPFIGGSGTVIYLPIGLSFYGIKGFNLGVDAGPATSFDNESGSNVFPYGGLKLGKRF